MLDLISIIVPVYNVEKYLRRCLDSIINQTYERLEIILVDDGSTDSSGVICDEYAKRDSRIIVIHKQNGGLSDARNKGLSVMNGDYVAFVDSDDYIHLNMISYLYNSIKTDCSDIAICGTEEFYENGEYKRFRSMDEKTIINEREAINYIFTGKLMIAVMNRLYRREILNNLVFSDGRLYEDVIFNTDLFLKNNRHLQISVLPNTGYYYLRRSNSIMGSTETVSPSVQLFYAYEYLLKHLSLIDSTAMYKIVPSVTYYLMSFIDNDKVSCSDDFIKNLKSYLKKYNKYISVSEVGFKYKMKLAKFLLFR